MTVKQQKIVLSGQAYVAPRAKSFRIANQGVLCSSSGGFGSSIKSLDTGSSAAGGSIRSWN